MNNAINWAHITITEDAEVVSVAEFRQRIGHLEDIVRRDRPACVGADEKIRWVRRAERVGGELISTTCKRAKPEDWARRERAIDASARAIGELFELTHPEAAE